MTGMRRHIAIAPATTSAASATSVAACAAHPCASARRARTSITLVSRGRLANRLRRSSTAPISRTPRSHHAAYESYMPSSGAGSCPPCRAVQSCHGSSVTTAAPVSSAASRHAGAPAARAAAAGTSTMPCVRTSAHTPMATPSSTTRQAGAGSSTSRSSATSSASAKARKNSSDSTRLLRMSSGTLTAVTAPTRDAPAGAHVESRARSSRATSTAAAARKTALNALNAATLAGERRRDEREEREQRGIARREVRPRRMARHVERRDSPAPSRARARG